MDYCLFQEAERKGLKLTISEAKKFTRGMKKKLEESKNNPEFGGELSDFEAIVAELGEDYYWEEYAPKTYQMH